METLNFRTNLADKQAIAAVTLPLNNNIEAVDGWNVDTSTPDHLLTVQTTDNRIADQITQAVHQAGYRAEPVSPDA